MVRVLARSLREEGLSGTRGGPTAKVRGCAAGRYVKTRRVTGCLPRAQFLREQGLFETREELQQREDVLGRLAAVAVEWVRKVTRALALGDDFAEMSRATIQTFGSYRLGVHGPGVATPLSLCIEACGCCHDASLREHVVTQLPGRASVLWLCRC